MVVTATEFKTNFGKYLALLSNGDAKITITKNGKKVAEVTAPQPSAVETLASLLSPDERNFDFDDIRKAAMEEKYEITL